MLNMIFPSSLIVVRDKVRGSVDVKVLRLSKGTSRPLLLLLLVPRRMSGGKSGLHLFPSVDAPAVVDRCPSVRLLYGSTGSGVLLIDELDPVFPMISEIIHVEQGVKRAVGTCQLLSTASPLREHIAELHKPFEDHGFLPAHPRQGDLAIRMGHAELQDYARVM